MIIDIANVTKKGCILNFVIINPFSPPIITHKSNETITAEPIFPSLPFIIDAQTKFTIEIVAPTDRSIPPTNNAIVCPIATIPSGAAERAIFNKCVGETVPFVDTKKTAIITSKSAYAPNGKLEYFNFPFLFCILSLLLSLDLKYHK